MYKGIMRFKVKGQIAQNGVYIPYPGTEKT